MKKFLFLALGLSSISLLSADMYYQQAPASGQNFRNQNQGFVPGDQQPQSYYNQRSVPGQQQPQVFYNQGAVPGQPIPQMRYNENNPMDQNMGAPQRPLDPSMNRGMDTNYHGPSDDEIQKNISETITYWSEKGINNISFHLDQGEVTLSGTVNSPEERTKVEDSIRRIPGIKNIHNEIKTPESLAPAAPAESKTSNLFKGKKKQISMSDSTATVAKRERDIGATENDKQLNRRIRDALRGLRIRKMETIVLKTDNGIVTITGILESPDDAKRITDQVKKINGVKSVSSDIQTSH